MPSVTGIVAVWALPTAARSKTRDAAWKRTVPVSFSPMAAASVATRVASFAAAPVDTEAAAPSAPPVVKSKTKSPPQTLASSRDSEKTSSTVVVVSVRADARAGPALSVASVPVASAAIKVEPV